MACASHDAFMRGGEGAIELAQAVKTAAAIGAKFRPLYRPDDSPYDKVSTLATKIYGAANVRWSAAAERSLARFADAGYGSLPICIAKTPLSLSHDPGLRGAPSGYTFPVQEVRLAAGAGLLNVLAGAIETMPGLPKQPRATLMDLDDRGDIIGLE